MRSNLRVCIRTFTLTLWGEGSNEGFSAQYSRSNLQPIYHMCLALIVAFGAFTVVGLLVPSSAQAAAATKDTRGATYEINFMTMMINHHYGAVKMSEICEKKARHNALEDRCESIIASQSDEIHTMQSWLSQWFGVHHDPQLPSGGQSMLDQLRSLSGKTFETTFLSMMIQHHSMAIEMSQGCLHQASHSKLLKMCQSIIASQSKEIRQMRGWLCDWYDKCSK